MADQGYDARGLNCPLPMLHAKKALKTLITG
jgi:TusA-related sulfurtransferase